MTPTCRFILHSDPLLIASHRRLRVALPGDAAVGGHASHAAGAGSWPEAEGWGCWGLEEGWHWKKLNI